MIWYGAVESFDFVPTGTATVEPLLGPGAAAKLTLGIDFLTWDQTKAN
eukprot:COSAG01_NODE_49055_length_375_cov_1.347826_1_plen_47_part_10